MDYDVVFPSIFVKSITLVFKEGSSSFATHCSAFCRYFSFRSSDFFLLMWRKLVLHRRHLRKMWSLQWVLFGYLPGFWDVSSPWLWVTIWRENQSQCSLNRQCELFWSRLATHRHMLSTALVELLWFGKKSVTDLLSVGTVIGFVVSHKICANSRKAM